MFASFAILSPCFASLFWAVFLLCKTKTNNRAQNAWARLQLLSTILAFIWATHLLTDAGQHPLYVLEIVEGVVVMWLLPFLYFFFRKLTNEKPLGWIDYASLLPGVFFGVAIAGFYAVMGLEEAERMLHVMANNKGQPGSLTDPIYQWYYLISVTAFNLVFRLGLLFLIAYACIRYFRYRRRLDEFYSDPEGQSMPNYRIQLIGTFLYLLLLAVAAVGRFYYKEHLPAASLLMLTMAVLVFFMGYNVALIHYSASELAVAQQQADQEAEEGGYAHSTFEQADPATTLADGTRWSELQSAFEQLLAREQSFLQCNLRLDDVARIMHTNRTYISRMINESYGCSFSDIINRHRILHAQRLIRNDHQLSQEQIAEQSGFTTAPSFSRMFKQQTGLTYREWRQQQVEI